MANNEKATYCTLNAATWRFLCTDYRLN